MIFAGRGHRKTAWDEGFGHIGKFTAVPIRPLPEIGDLDMARSKHRTLFRNPFPEETSADYAFARYFPTTLAHASTKSCSGLMNVPAK